MKLRLLHAIFFLSAGFGFSACSFAQTIEVLATDSGWYHEQGRHDANNENYISGQVSLTGDLHHHNFFVFDLASIDVPIMAAVFRVYTWDVRASDIYTLYDVSTPIPVLTASGSNEVAVYNDLGSGTVYGNTSILVDQDNQFIDIALNSDAISSITLANGDWAIGGDFASTIDWAFGSSTLDENTPRLILEAIPIPPTVWLFGSGLLGLVGIARRKRAA